MATAQRARHDRDLLIDSDQLFFDDEHRNAEVEKLGESLSHDAHQVYKADSIQHHESIPQASHFIIALVVSLQMYLTKDSRNGSVDKRNIERPNTQNKSIYEAVLSLTGIHQRRMRHEFPSWTRCISSTVMVQPKQIVKKKHI